MGFWSDNAGNIISAIGSIFGGGASAASNMINYNQAKKLMDKQYDMNMKALLEVPAQSRKGFTQAGFNPLLSLGSGQAGFSASSSGVGADLSSGMEQGINSALAIRQNKAQVKNIQADTFLKGAQADTEKARQIQMEFQNAMYDVEKHLKQKDLDTYDRRFYSMLYEQMQRAENYRANSAVAQYNAETGRISAEANAMNSRTNSAVGASQAWRNYNASLGYTSSGKFGPFSFSHTGNPNAYTKHRNNDSQGRYHYETETIRGKKVRVKVYD